MVEEAVLRVLRSQDSNHTIMSMNRDQQEEFMRLKFMEFMFHALAGGIQDESDEDVNPYSYHRQSSVITNLGSLPLHEFAKNAQMKNIKKHLNCSKNEVDCTDPDSGVTPLMTACFYGHLNVVKLLVSRGANVNFKCSGLSGYGLRYSNITPAYIAAEEGREEVLKYLVDKGADLNQKCSPLGYTPLHRAVSRGHEDVVFLMVVGLKAKVNISNSDGDDPVLTAVKLKHQEILDTLVSAEGVDCSVPNTNDQLTPLHYASYYGNTKAVQALCTFGKAKLDAVVVGGFTPMDLAIQQKHKRISEFLKKVGAPRNARNGRWQPYFDAVAGGLLPLRDAINKGANINATVVRGGTALHYNIVKLNWEACKFLLRKGADVNFQDYLGNTPLHVAANVGRTDYIKLLLDNGAKVNALNGAHSTPLHAAAKKGNYSAVSFMMSNGADPNIDECDGGSPIFSAAVNGHDNVVTLFLIKGVDPNSKARIDTVDDVSVLAVACTHAAHKPEVIRALVNGGANVNSSVASPGGELTLLHLLPTERYNYVESLRILIEAGSFIDAEVKTRMTMKLGNSKNFVEMAGTPLMRIRGTKNPHAIKLMSNTLELFKAVRKNDLKLAKESVALGGLVNCCSVKFETPLTYASWKGYLSMVKFLLAQGAYLNLKGVQKSSPLHYAAKFNQKPVVIELLRAGAKYDGLCCNKTPLQLAEENNHMEIAAILKFFGQWLASSGSSGICPKTKSSADPKFKQLLEGTNDKVLEKDLCALFGGV